MATGRSINFTAWIDLHREATPLRSQSIPRLDYYKPEALTVLGQECGMQFGLMRDRNVITRVVDLAKPTTTRRIVDHRRAAALTTYARLLNIRFDHCIATYELADSSSRKAFGDEISAFLTLQNVDPLVYIDIALRSRDQIDRSEYAHDQIPARKSEAKLMSSTYAPNSYRADYGALLKLAVLIRDAEPKMPTADDFERHIRWMHEEYMFLAPPLIYGSLAMSPKRQGKMLK